LAVFLRSGNCRS